MIFTENHSDHLFLSEFALFTYENRNGKVHSFPLGAVYSYFATVLTGSARFVSADGTEIIAEPGELLFLPKGCAYTSYWCGSPTCRFYSLRFAFLSEEENHSYAMQKVSSPAPLAGILKDIAEADNPATALSMFYGLYAAATRSMKKARDPQIRTKIRPAIQALNGKGNKYDIPKLATLCHMSPTHFYRVFRKEMGVTPVEYKNRLRCQKAIELLITTDLTVEEIATRVGCSTAAYLRRLLKKFDGHSPRQIRNDAERSS